MALILETKNFIIEGHDLPHHSRENGGHIRITPKMTVEHRYELPVDIAVELMFVTMIVGEAVSDTAEGRGLKFARINYQDNGNWAYKTVGNRNQLHIHLYVRTWDEKHPDGHPLFQAFPEALVFPDRSTGFYDQFEPMNNDECALINTRISELLETEKYRGRIEL